METAINIFPNPAQNQFTLRSDISLEKLTIFDISGRRVNNVDLTNMSHDKIIDISSLDAGIYIVQITGERGSIVKQLLKQ